MTLDSLDTEIIRLMVSDARMSNKAIADQTDVTVATVSARLKKLFDANVIKILPCFDWSSSGYEVEALVYVEVGRVSPSDVAKTISSFNGVLTAAVTLGAFDLILLVIMPDEASLYDLVSRITDVDGVVNVQLDRIVKVFLYNSNFVRLPAKVTKPESLPSPVIVLDALDRSIIEILQGDGRRSSREIGRQLGIHDAKIRSRIRRIEESGLVRLRTVVDPVRSEPGAQTAYVLALVAQGNPAAVAARLANLPGVIFVALTQGRYEIVLVVSAPLKALKNLLEREIWGKADVRSTRSFMIVKGRRASADLIRI